MKELYHLILNGRQCGPYELDQLKEMLNKGVLKGDTFIWHSGQVQWQHISQFRALFESPSESSGQSQPCAVHDSEAANPPTLVVDTHNLARSARDAFEKTILVDGLPGAGQAKSCSAPGKKTGTISASWAPGNGLARSSISSPGGGIQSTLGRIRWMWGTRDAGLNRSWSANTINTFLIFLAILLIALLIYLIRNIMALLK